MIFKKEGFKFLMKSFLVVSIFILSSLFVSAACDTTISGCQVLNSADTTYCLDTDILNDDGNCFQITADNVTLDCQGHLVDGDNDTSGYGIYQDTHHDYTKITNCNITEFYYGIYFRDAYITTSRNDYLNLSYNNIYNNLNYGFYARFENYSYIHNNNFSGHPGTFGDVYFQQFSENLHIYDNNFENSDRGVSFGGGTDNNISDSKIYGNTFTGHTINAIYFSYVKNISVYDNQINSTAIGIRLEANSKNNVISDNVIVGDNPTVSLIGYNNELIGNNISGSSVACVGFNGGNNTLRNNNIWDCSSQTVSSGVTDTNYLIYNNSFAEIIYSNRALTTTQDLIIGDTVYLEDNLVGYKSADPIDDGLNGSAQIKLHGVNGGNRMLLKDDVRCDDTNNCNISYDGDTVIADISSFSNYTTNLIDSLTIWDETESDGSPYSGQTKYVGEQIRFFANYSNTTGPILSANCDVYFADNGWDDMTYNTTTTYYEYNRSFSTSGIRSWEVNCSVAGHASLNLSDTVTVSEVVTPVPEFEDYAMIFLLVTVIGGFLVIRNKQE